MNTLTFTATDTVFTQLQKLSRITKRPVSDLINDLLCGELDQMIARKDTDYMRLVLDDVEYPDHATAETVAENYNALNRATVIGSANGQWHICIARAGDDNVIHFTESRLVKASDLEPAGK